MKTDEAAETQLNGIVNSCDDVWNRDRPKAGVWPPARLEYGALGVLPCEVAVGAELERKVPDPPKDRTASPVEAVVERSGSSWLKLRSSTPSDCIMPTSA